jgi:hypothetical protein
MQGSENESAQTGQKTEKVFLRSIHSSPIWRDG